MDLKEFYSAIGGNYDEALKRLMRDALVMKFVLKFEKDDSYQSLVKALKEQNCEEAFRAAHTLKGVSRNLSFDALGDASDELTEILRGGDLEHAGQSAAKTAEEYMRVMNAIEELKKGL